MSVKLQSSTKRSRTVKLVFLINMRLFMCDSRDKKGFVGLCIDKTEASSGARKNGSGGSGRKQNEHKTNEI